MGNRESVFVALLPLPRLRRVRSAPRRIVVAAVAALMSGRGPAGSGKAGDGIQLPCSAAQPDPAGQFWLTHGAGRLSEFARLVLLLACQTAWWVKGPWADRHENITKITHPHLSIKSHSHMGVWIAAGRVKGSVEINVL